MTDLFLNLRRCWWCQIRIIGLIFVRAMVSVSVPISEIGCSGVGGSSTINPSKGMS